VVTPKQINGYIPGVAKRERVRRYLREDRFQAFYPEPGNAFEIGVLHEVGGTTEEASLLGLTVKRPTPVFGPEDPGQSGRPSPFRQPVLEQKTVDANSKRKQDPEIDGLGGTHRGDCGPLNLHPIGVEENDGASPGPVGLLTPPQKVVVRILRDDLDPRGDRWKEISEPLQVSRVLGVVLNKDVLCKRWRRLKCYLSAALSQGISI